MPLEKLWHTAQSNLDKQSFRPMDEGGGERHGTWEWTWIKMTRRLTFGNRAHDWNAER